MTITANDPAVHSMIVGAESLLARTAIELAARHPIRQGIKGEPWCLNCWAPWPCGPAQHAREVCNAAGVALPKAGRSGARPTLPQDTGSYYAPRLPYDPPLTDPVTSDPVRSDPFPIDRSSPDLSSPDPLPIATAGIGGGARAAY